MRLRCYAKFTKAFLEQTDSTTKKGDCYHGNVMVYARICGERKSLNEKNKRDEQAGWGQQANDAVLR